MIRKHLREEVQPVTSVLQEREVRTPDSHTVKKGSTAHLLGGFLAVLSCAEDPADAAQLGRRQSGAIPFLEQALEVLDQPSRPTAPTSRPAMRRNVSLGSC